MKMTFPHMGNTFVVAKALLDDFNHEYVIPPYNNKKALEIGTRYAPEQACLPLKINIGNYIQAYEKGADTVVISGGCGPCRFGYYCEMSREILNDAGYKMNLVTIDAPNGDMKGFIERVKILAKGLNLAKIVKVVGKVTLVAKEVDELEALTYKTRPREIMKGDTDKIYNSFKEAVLQVKGSKEIRDLIKNTKKKLLSIKLDENFEPLKVGIVGEIYTTIDPYSNLYIERKLGNMGVEVERKVNVSGWIIDHMIKPALGIRTKHEYREAAKPYLSIPIGGHAQETIGNTIIYAEKGYDGVIQLFPMTCMPEIVAESILTAVERDYNMPILKLIIDEMTGEEGYITRLEAYVDLLLKRKERRELAKNELLFGN